MSIIEILLPISILLAGSFALAFILAVRSGQYDDVDTPAQRILFDAPKTRVEDEKLTQENGNKVSLFQGPTSDKSTGETT